MNDKKKSKDQLIMELIRLREKIRKRDEKAWELSDELDRLLLADELQRIALDVLPVFVIFDKNGIIQFVNQYHIKSFSKDRLSRDQIIGKDIRNLHKSAQIGITKEYEKILKGETIELENMYFPEFSSGHSGYVNCLGIPLMKDGRVIGGVLIRQDVTEPKESEKALLESKAKYDAIFHNTNDAITIHDMKGNVLDVNQRFLDLLGYSRDEILSYKIRAFHPPEALREVREQTKKISRNGFINFETEFIKKNGEIFSAEVTATLFELDDGQVVQGLARDISERKKAEMALKESEKRFRTLFEQSIDAIIIHEGGKIRDVNDSACKILGYSKDQLRTMTVMDLHRESDREKIKKMVGRKKRWLQFETQWIKADGTTMDVEINSNIIDFKKRLTKAVIRDITKRRRAEAKLRESEKLYRTLVENIKLGINLIDSDYNIVMVNTVPSRKFGKPTPEIVGEKCYREFEKRDSVCQHCPGVQAMAAGKPKVIETEGVLDSGSRFNVKIQAFPIFGQDGRAKGFIEVVEDITESKRVEEEKRKLETQLLQSEKMASVGQLAAGVAHEINNPTGFVSSNLKTLSDYQNDIISLIKEYSKLIADLKEAMATAEYPGSIPEQMERIAALESKVDINYILDDIPNLLKESQEGTERIKKIVIDLKDFAHPGEDKVQATDVNKGIESTLNIVWHELKYKATVTKEYGDLPLVKCYPQQLNQVFMNLMLNAAQAIEKEGKIRIATRAMDGHVEIAISDTGVGIHKENLSKIFDPFFTTKEVGKGTGLGLNIAYNIIKDHKGAIDVESEVGKGTTFTIRIPVG